MATENKYRMSQSQLDKLVEELKHMEEVETKEVAELIKEARSFGDLSENSEYDEAKTVQGKLYSRIAELEEILENAVIISEESGSDGNRISIGCKVVVTNLNTGKTMPAFKIVGSQEADAMHGAMSEDSPVGKAVMGATVGDEVKVEAPSGVIPYRIESIEH